MGGTILNDSNGVQDLNEIQTEGIGVNPDTPVYIEETRSIDEMEHEVINEANRDLIKQFVGIFSAFIPILAAFGYRFEWLNEDMITMVATAIVLTTSFIVSVYTMWKNHYTSKKARKQKLALKQRGLK